MARTYKRDARGRFASGGGGGKSGGGKGGSSRKPSSGGGKQGGRKPAASSKPAPPKWSPEMKAARSASQKSKPANKIAPSPRRFNAEERAYAQLAVSSKFRTDASRRREMERLGFNGSQENLIRVAASVRAKVAKPGERVGNTYAVSKDAIRKALGVTKQTRKRKG